MTDKKRICRMSFITNKEILKLRDMVEGTEAESLFKKMHYSYNIALSFARNMKKENDRLLENNLKKC